jgi:hypothetical protein
MSKENSLKRLPTHEMFRHGKLPRTVETNDMDFELSYNPDDFLPTALPEVSLDREEESTDTPMEGNETSNQLSSKATSLSAVDNKWMNLLNCLPQKVTQLVYHPGLTNIGS